MRGFLSDRLVGDRPIGCISTKTHWNKSKVPEQIAPALLFCAGELVVVVQIAQIGWEELIGGEFQSAEQLARIARDGVASRIATAGDTEVVGGNHHLYSPLQLDNNEDTQCDVQLLFSGTATEVASEAAADLVREGTAIVAGVTVFDLHQLAGQYNGLCHLQAGGGHVVNEPGGIALVAAEHLYASLAAVENYLLCKGCDACDGCGLAHGRDIGCCLYQEEEGNIHRVETTVKGYCFHVQIDVEDFHLLNLHRDTVVENGLCLVGEVDGQILQAVFIVDTTAL